MDVNCWGWSSEGIQILSLMVYYSILVKHCLLMNCSTLAAMAKEEDYILTSFYLTAYSNGNMSTVCSHTVDGVSKVH